MKATLKSVAESVDGLSIRVDSLSIRVDSLSDGVDSLSTRVDSLSTRVDSLSTRVDSLSTRVDSLSTSVDSLSTRVDALSASVDGRFEQVDKRFDSMEVRIRTEGEDVRRYVDERLQGAVDDMRRYFEIVAEQMKAERNLVLDRSLHAAEGIERLRATNAADHVVFETKLADHEARLARLESE